MSKPSLVVLILVLLVTFCATRNNEFDDNKELLHRRNVEATWKMLMARSRSLKDIRSIRQVRKREINFLQESPAAVDEKQDEVVDFDDVVIKNLGSKLVESCNTTDTITSCSVTANETLTIHNSSSSSVTNNSNNNSNSNSSNGSSSTSGGGGGTTSNTSNTSSSSSSSSGGKKK